VQQGSLPLTFRISPVPISAEQKEEVARLFLGTWSTLLVVEVVLNVNEMLL
jgi:hypothetical protein